MGNEANKTFLTLMLPVPVTETEAEAIRGAAFLVVPFFLPSEIPLAQKTITGTENLLKQLRKTVAHHKQVVEGKDGAALAAECAKTLEVMAKTIDAALSMHAQTIEIIGRGRMVPPGGDTAPRGEGEVH